MSADTGAIPRRAIMDLDGDRFRFLAYLIGLQIDYPGQALTLLLIESGWNRRRDREWYQRELRVLEKCGYLTRVTGEGRGILGCRVHLAPPDPVRLVLTAFSQVHRGLFSAELRAQIDELLGEQAAASWVASGIVPASPSAQTLQGPPPATKTLQGPPPLEDRLPTIDDFGGADPFPPVLRDELAGCKGTIMAEAKDVEGGDDV